jgi:tetratricopeptide (TPR) repeat protein
LNSGEVVVRSIGSDLRMDYTAVGQTTHLAARMEQMATPGSVLITAQTLHLVDAWVQVNPLGPMPVRGMMSPVEVFELLGAGATQTRLQALAARELTHFVGRQVELEALRRSMEAAANGHGQIIAVIGEPGVGKTRLFYELICSHRTQGWLVCESQAVSYGQAIPYRPIRDLLTAYFQIDEHDEVQKSRDKVTGKLVTMETALGPTLPAFLSLLDLPVEDRTWQDLDLSQRRQRTREAIKHLLLRESQVQPVLLVVENLHWIDAETQACLDDLVDSLPAARLLLLVNYRPEYQHGWGSKTYYTQLRLDPLPPASADAFLQSLLGGDPSLVPLKRMLIVRTEGNPFFLEESVRTLVESGVLAGEWGTYRLVKPLDSLQVPATVQAVLAARIDRLPSEEKHLLQTAAVIGTEVPWPLLRAIAELPDDILHRNVMRLQTAEFLYETRLFPDHEYTFKHALTHEVVYSSLLQERRRALHARIVEAIEALAAGRVAEQLERLAHHALRGEVWDKAVTYGEQAGARAHDRAAFLEAAAYMEQALQALEHLNEHSDTRRLALELRLALTRPLSALGEHGRHLALLGEAEALARALDDRTRLVQVLARMAYVHRLLGDHDGAIAAGEQALALATALGENALQAEAAHHLGQAYNLIGDFDRSAALLRRSVEAADREPGRPGIGLRIDSRAWLARTLSALGAFAEGRRYGEEALCLATLEGRGSTLIIVLTSLGSLYLAQGDVGHAIQVLEQGLALCRTSGHWTNLRPIASALGTAYSWQGRLAEGCALVQEAISEGVRTGTLANHSRWIARLSEVCRLAGRHEEAWQHAHQALDLARQHKERANEAHALHQLGIIQAHASPLDVPQAEAFYQQALALAEELAMRPLMAHCHHGLGTLYAMHGQEAQAGAELSTAIDLYRAMDMTFWLPQAEATLAQVEGR